MRLFYGLSLCLFHHLLAVNSELNSLNQEIYDYDTSWAIKSKVLSNRLGDKQSFYNSFIDGCHEAAGSPKKAKAACDSGETFRIRMNNLQPKSMRNYTKLGFSKIRAPPETFKLINDFWQKYKEKNQSEWHSVNTYHNMWESPPNLINIQEPSQGGGQALTFDIWESARQTLEEWTAPHLDRNPLITSAIINVDQDVDEPWPLEVWGHDGKPYNISMEPGDMVLYESHSILHGRPFPMRGRFFANIFVHFEPLGTYRKDHNDFTSENVYQDEALESLEVGLPPYLIPGSPWETEWRDSNPNGWRLLHNDMKIGIVSNNLRIVDNLYIQNEDSIHEVDKNGWSPLHEAARAGHVEIARYLCDRDVDLELRTGNGTGQTALEIALEFHGEESEIYQFLLEVGAEEEL